MSTFTRTDWGARPPVDTTPMTASEVVGLAIHWPGMESPIHGTDAVERALRGWQNDHMDIRGWDDIAYNEAVDQGGNLYQLRGFGHRSAANGDTATNTAYSALLLILAPGEAPSAAMIATVRTRVAAHRKLFPSSRLIVPHSKIRPSGTICPGDVVRAAISAGKFEPVVVRKTPLITAFRLAETNAERQRIAQQIIDGPNEAAGAQARAFLTADNARTAATKDRAAAAGALLALEVK